MRSRRIGDQIAVQLQACGTAVIENQRKAVDSASFILKSSIEGELTRAIGSDHAMSNVKSSVRYSRRSQKRTVGDNSGGKAARLGVRYDIKGTTNPTSLLRAWGPWGLVEYRVDPHEIFVRTDAIQQRGVKRADFLRAVEQRRLNQAFGARGTYAGRRPMPVAPGVFRYSVRNHPGTGTAKQPFRKGMDKAEPSARRELNTVVLRGVAMVWNRGRETITIFREG